MEDYKTELSVGRREFRDSTESIRGRMIKDCIFVASRNISSIWSL